MKKVFKLLGVLLITVLAVSALLIVIHQHTAETTPWGETASTAESEETICYKGGLYTKDYTKLVKWPELSDEEIEQYDIERRSYTHHYFKNQILLHPDNFHPDLKIIGAEAFSGNTQISQVGIPWGVEEIQADAFLGCALSVYIPDTVIRISSDNDPYATPGTFITYIYSPFNEAAKNNLNSSGKAFEDDSDSWCRMYRILAGRWKLINGRLYRFSGGDVPQMLTGTQVIDGVPYHFTETGGLLSAGLPEGDYELDGIGIHVDSKGNITVRQ